MLRVSLCVFQKEESHQTRVVGDRSILGLWRSLFLANEPKGRSCPPLPLLSAVGQT